MAWIKCHLLLDFHCILREQKNRCIKLASTSCGETFYRYMYMYMYTYACIIIIIIINTNKQFIFAFRNN